jgi:hypothetical protein
MVSVYGPYENGVKITTARRVQRSCECYGGLSQWQNIPLPRYFVNLLVNILFKIGSAMD